MSAELEEGKSVEDSERVRLLKEAMSLSSQHRPSTLQAFQAFWPTAQHSERVVLKNCAVNALAASSIMAGLGFGGSYAFLKGFGHNAPRHLKLFFMGTSTLAGVMAGPLLTVRHCLESMVDLEDTSELKKALLEHVHEHNPRINDQRDYEDLQTRMKAQDNDS